MTEIPRLYMNLIKQMVDQDQSDDLPPRKQRLSRALTYLAQDADAKQNTIEIPAETLNPVKENSEES